MKDELEKIFAKTGDVALRRRAVWLIEYLKLKDSLKILDLGCGDGYYLHILTNLKLKNLKLTGLDSDTKALKSAKNNLRGKNVKLIRDSAQKLPFQNNSFDRIIASEVLEHIRDDKSALLEIKRVLKKGGIFVCSVPNINFPFFWDPINWILQNVFNTHIQNGFFAGIWNQHQRLYSQRKINSLLKEAGFNNVVVKPLTHFCLPFNHYLVNLTARFLAKQKQNSGAKMLLSKFGDVKKRTNPIFGILFFIDRLNDIFPGNNSAVSLVAYARK